MGSAIQFSLARAGLGIGEAGNFPGGVKAVTEWFPRKERAFATGLFNAGSNIGAILTPLLLWVIIDHLGLRLAHGLLSHRHFRLSSGWQPGG